MIQTAREADYQTTVDRRRSERLPVSTAACVSILGSGKSLTGQVIQVSDNGLQLVVAEPLRPGTLLEVVWNDTLALGEVVHTRREAEQFVSGVKAHHAIFGMAELAKALQSSEWYPAQR